MAGLLAAAAPLGIALPPDPVSLGEGHTPLLPSRAIGPGWGLRRLFFKADHLNPTGSYKDRFIVFEVNRLLAAGATACLATSSGNTGSSLAAYAARAGIAVTLAINELTPVGKLSQMAAHGARLLRVRGFGRGAAETAHIWAHLQELAAARELPLIVSAFRYCPGAMRGVSTLSHEVLAALGEPPAACFVPVGGGGLFCAVAMGFEDHGGGVRMEPVQPLTNDTVITALRTGGQAATAVVDGPGCGISGLSVPIDIDGAAVLRHARASGGRGFLVDEERVRALQERLYREEGIGVEPASAVALAGVEQALHEGRLDPEALVVALLTGHGFKEPQREAAIAAAVPVREVGEEELAAALTAAT